MKAPVESPPVTACSRSSPSLASPAAGELSNARRSGPIATALLEYLAKQFGSSALGYRQEPARLGNGWQTYVYRLELANTDRMPAGFAGPLVLRLFTNAAGSATCRYEVAVQRYLYLRGIPVAEPVWCEDGAAALGGPFFLMKEIPGPTLMDYLLRRPWRVVAGAWQMANAQARLHHLDPDGFPRRGDDLLSRSLHDIDRLMHMHRLQALTPGQRWLLAHRPPPPKKPAILHLDTHPFNLIVQPGRGLAILDWDKADVGDPHADFANTLVLLRCMPHEATTVGKRFLGLIGRGIFRRNYLRACRRWMPVDATRLAYYEAWTVMRRLSWYGQWFNIGPQANGLRPSIVGHLDRAHLDGMCSWFARLTGIALRLEGPPWNAVDV